MNTTRCNCPEDSPFLWRTRQRDSIFMADPTMRPVGQKGESKSQRATAVIERDRKIGKNTGTLYGIGKKERNAPPPPTVLAKRPPIHAYSKAKSETSIHKD